MSSAVVLLTRDLRVRDQPAPAAVARKAEPVIPLFVLDDELLHRRWGAPNRLTFLLDCLRDLDRSLRDPVVDHAATAEAFGSLRAERQARDRRGGLDR